MNLSLLEIKKLSTAKELLLSDNGHPPSLYTKLLIHLLALKYFKMYTAHTQPFILVIVILCNNMSKAIHWHRFKRWV